MTLSPFIGDGAWDCTGIFFIRPCSVRVLIGEGRPLRLNSSLDRVHAVSHIRSAHVHEVLECRVL